MRAHLLPPPARPLLPRAAGPLLHPVGLLVAVALLAYLVPARVIVPGLTSIGRPATLLAIGLLLAWLCAQLHPELAARGRQPMRWAVATYAMALTASYAAGELRGLTEAESNSAHRTMLAAAAMAGMAVMAADGLRRSEHIDTLLKAVFWAGTVMSAVGITQFAVRQDITVHFHIPGLAFQSPPVGFSPRGADGLLRVAGTVGHYIEFSVLIAAVVVPLGLHYSRYATHALERQLTAIATVVSACAIPLALSRSGVLTFAIAWAVACIAWSWQRRIVIALIIATTAVAYSIVRPGQLGTLRALFTNSANDPSINARTERYDLVFPMISERILLGRGTGTFIPEQYPLLDNQWLLTMVSSGIIGVAGLLMLFATGIWLGVAVWRRATRESERHLAACLVAGLVAFAFAAATFDALFFTTYVVTFGLLLGAVGALWQIVESGRARGGH